MFKQFHFFKYCLSSSVSKPHCSTMFFKESKEIQFRVLKSLWCFLNAHFNKIMQQVFLRTLCDLRSCHPAL